MQTSFEPLSSKQQAELRGYISVPVRFIRAVLFLAIVLLVGAGLKSIHAAFAPKQGFASSPILWIIPGLAFAAWFYSCWQRWAGGTRGTANIRKDLVRGELAIHRVEILDAIEIEELEDEGPSYFVLTPDNEVIYLSGQWLDREKRKGFPWKSFEIREAPASKVFFGLKKTGERFTPSFIRKALDWDTLKQYQAFKGKYRLLDENFESLKRDPH